ncbi:MAG: hypothetical protein ACE37K_02745 [Planctomycetota bacterium]
MTDSAAEPRPDDGSAPEVDARPLLPQRLARIARRATLVLGLVAVAWFLLKFETRWVPPGMNTITEVPGGSWVILDRWTTGLRVGSDVFVRTPHGEQVSRVKALDAETVTIEHPNPDATWGDSRVFGPLPREQILGTIVVVFAPDREQRGG